MKRLTRWLLPLLFAGAAYGAFTDGLTADSKIAFGIDSWTSNAEYPANVGGANYVVWDTTGYFSQAADWAWKLCADVGWRNYRVFATGGQMVTGSTGASAAGYNFDDIVAWAPDVVFLLGGINDCAGATDGAENALATRVCDSLQAGITKFQNAGAKVCITELHGCSSYATFDQYADSSRAQANSWINALTENDDLVIHADQWLYDTLGTHANGIDSIGIASPYDSGDLIHLTQAANYQRGDSLWVNTLGSLSFAKAAQTYYVDIATGDDWENTGITSAAPLKTLQAALLRARSGDSIQMISGEYDNIVVDPAAWYRYTVFVLRRTGSSASPIHIYGNGSTFTNSHTDSTRYTCVTIPSDSSYYTFHDITFADYVYPFLHDGDRGLRYDGCSFDNMSSYGYYANDAVDLRFDDCSFHGGGPLVDGTSYVRLYGCDFTRDLTYANSTLLRIDDCDSVIVVDGTFYAKIDSQNNMVYISVTAPAGDDVYRFINCDFNADGVDGRALYIPNNLEGTLELKNSIFRNAAGYTFIARNTLTYDVDNNFLLGDLYNSGAVNIATWRTESGGANQWDYAPALSDTVRYGGERPTNDYAAYLGIPHSRQFCSIGITQYSEPTIPDRFATATNADSLVDYIGWIWSAGDTLRSTEWDKYIEPSSLTIEIDTGVAPRWRGGFN